MPFYRPVRNIQALTRVSVTRRLSAPGRVLVKPGDRVSFLDRIAVRPRKHELRLLNVAEELGVAPGQAMKRVLVRPGQIVAEGDILAEKPGLFARRVKAPTRGRVLYVGRGTIVLQHIADEEPLLAGIVGEVEEVIPNYGARIVASGLYMTGVWGNGRIDGGIGYLTPAFPTGVLEEDGITLEHRGSVLIAQSVAGAEVLRRGEEVGIKGLLVGYLNPEVLTAARRVAYPVLVLEGFAEMPFTDAALPVLQGLDRRDLVLCAEAPDRKTGHRPWVFSPQESYEALRTSRAGAALEPEARVRVLRGRVRGQTGRVVEIPSEPRRFPSGLQGYMVKLRINEEVVEVPVPNVELVE